MKDGHFEGTLDFNGRVTVACSGRSLGHELPMELPCFFMAGGGCFQSSVGLLDIVQDLPPTACTCRDNAELVRRTRHPKLYAARVLQEGRGGREHQGQAPGHVPWDAVTPM